MVSRYLKSNEITRYLDISTVVQNTIENYTNIVDVLSTNSESAHHKIGFSKPGIIRMGANSKIGPPKLRIFGQLKNLNLIEINLLFLFCVEF